VVLATAAEERLTFAASLLEPYLHTGTLHARVEFTRVGAYLSPSTLQHAPFNLRLDTVGWTGVPDALLLGTLLPLSYCLLAAAALLGAAAYVHVHATKQTKVK
jgi:hypothetical protein